MEQKIFKVTVPGKPIALSRPRFRRIGKFVQTYNSQSKDEEAFKNAVKAQLTKEEHDFLIELLSSDKEFYVSLGCIFYVPVQKNSSKKALQKKLNNEVKPNIRPDIDNYLKFVMDSIHNVFYLDDSCVTELTNVSKRYSDIPRTELTVIIDY